MRLIEYAGALDRTLLRAIGEGVGTATADDIALGNTMREHAKHKSTIHRLEALNVTKKIPVDQETSRRAIRRDTHTHTQKHTHTHTLPKMLNACWAVGGLVGHIARNCLSECFLYART